MISKRDVQLGKIALSEKMVSKEQINKCLKIKKKLKTKASLGAILVKKGYIDKDQLEVIVRIHNEQTAEKSSDSSSRKSKRKKKRRPTKSQSPDEKDQSAEGEEAKDEADDKDEDSSKSRRKSQRRRRKTKTRDEDGDTEKDSEKDSAKDADKDADKDSDKDADDKAERRKSKRRKTKTKRRSKRQKKVSEDDKDSEKDSAKDDKDSGKDSGKDEELPLKSDDVLGSGILTSADDDQERTGGGVITTGAYEPEDPSIMEALLASTLEGGPDLGSGEFTGSMVSDSLFESADMTESTDEVDDSTGKVKKKIIACGDCGKKYRVKPRQAGKRFSCRRCDAKVRVPKDYFDDEDEEDVSTSRKRKRRRKTRSGKKKSRSRRVKASKPKIEVEEFDLGGLGDDDDEASDEKPRKGRSGRDRKKKDEAAPVVEASYASLVAAAEKAERKGPKQQKMSTGAIVQALVFSLMLVGMIGGFFGYRQYQEQLRIAARKKAIADEWKQFEDNTKATLEQAQALASREDLQGEVDAAKLESMASTLAGVEAQEQNLRNKVNRDKARVLFEKTYKTKSMRHDMLMKSGAILAKIPTFPTLENAVRRYRDALKVDDSKAESWVILADALSNLHDWKKSISAAKSALKIDSKNQRALAIKGHTYEIADDPSSASDAYELLARSEPFAGVWHARSLARTKAYADSLKILSKLGGLEAVQSDAVKKAAVEVMRGWVHERKGEPNEAEEAYKRALSANAEAPWPKVALGNLYLSQGQYQEALTFFQEAKSKQGGAPAVLGLGRAQQGLGDIDTALQTFRDGSEASNEGRAVGPMIAGYPAIFDPMEPENAPSECRRRMADLLLTLGKTDEAVIEYEEALNLDPWNVVARSRLSVVFLERGDADRAEQNMYVAERLTQGVKGGSSLLFDGKPRIRSEGTAEVFLTLSLIAQKREDLGRADQAVTLALELDPQRSDILLAHAGILLQRNEKVKAQRKFRTAATLERTQKSYKGVGDSLAKLKRDGATKSAWQELLSRCHGLLAEKHRHTFGLIARGKAWAGLGKIKDATADFDRALQLNPNNGEAYFARARLHLGWLGKQSPDYELAHKDLSKALRFQVDTGRAHLGMALCQFHLRKIDEALASATKAINKESSLKQAYVLRAKIFDLKGRKKDADRDRKRADRLKD